MSSEKVAQITDSTAPISTPNNRTPFIYEDYVAKKYSIFKALEKKNRVNWDLPTNFAKFVLDDQQPSTRDLLAHPIQFIGEDNKNTIKTFCPGQTASSWLIGFDSAVTKDRILKQNLMMFGKIKMTDTNEARPMPSVTWSGKFRIHKLQPQIKLEKVEILTNAIEIESGIDEFNKKLTNDILAAADQYIPNITSRKKNSNLPPPILNMIKKRKEIRARIHKTNQASDKTENDKIKKEINLAIGKKVDQSWNKFLKKCGRSPLSAKPWKRINNFRSNETNKNIPTLIQGNSNYDTDLEKANAFGDMLEKIFNDNNNTSFDENFKNKIEKENSNFNYSNKNQHCDKILPVDLPAHSWF